MSIEDLLINIGLGICGVVLVAVLYVIFIVLPVALHAEAKCLAAGYPRAAVTYKLDVYCLNLDGSVRVRVDKQ